MHNVERNVVYGMYSGLALLMDVYHPAESNGHGPKFPGAVNPPDYLSAMVRWFNKHLRGNAE